MSYSRLLQDLQSDGFNGFIGVHRELKYLVKTLPRDENVQAAVKGYFNGNTVLFVVTNQRVLLINVRLLYGVSVSEISFSLIDSMSFTSGFIFSRLDITHGSHVSQVNGIYRRLVPLLHQKFRQALDTYRDKSNEQYFSVNKKNDKISNAASLNDDELSNQNDIGTQLMQLRTLLNEGSLTKEEFTEAKRKLLGHKF